jgi:crotonobetainyl-CoA:carnitine CoA-transferase CaiB-like acyl-CoA transferase
MTGALAGLRVVEIAHDIAGPYCTKLLVDLGADVYKIEPPGGDPLRRWGPFPDGVPNPERSGLFEYINAGKRGVSLDLANQADGDVARELIGAADILVENLGPGTLDRSEWGLDRDGLSRLNPGLVVVRISDFGQDGPLRDRETTPLTMQAAAGWVSLRDQDRPPVQAGARISEFVAGAYAALGGLTALRVAAANPGELIEVDVSTFESLVSTLPYPMLMAERMKLQGRPANSKAGPMLGIVRAADGLVGVNCLTGQHWLDVCAMVGLPEFGEHQLAIMMGGPERGEFFAKAQPWFDEQTVADIVDLSQAMRVPAAPVSDGASIHACPQYAERGFFVDLQRDGWQFERPGSAFRMSKSPVEPPRPAPPLGSAEVAAFADRVVGEAAPAAALPFAGLKILDLTTFWAGAYLTCYLGAFGADVMKVESIQRPDGFRYSGAQVGATEDWYERGPLWQGANLNKRDITLDLSTDRGRELALALAAEADVVVENFSPRVVEHFGLDYESLVGVNPDIIMVRMPGFGLVGPWRDYVGWALNFEQVSGMAAATGYPDGPPCDLQGPADPIAGVHATIALLAALDHRRRTGEGQLVEIAQIEACAAVAAQPVIEFSVTGVVPEREGNRHRVYVQGVYPAAGDTWVAVSVRGDSDWAALLEAIGRPELLNDNRFGTAEQRRSNHDAFDEMIGEWTRTRSPDEIVDALSARGVPAERLMTPGRMYDIVQLDARDYYQELVHPITGPHRFPGWPFRITPGPRRHHRTAPPTLGQHNTEVLAELGLTAGEIDALRDQRVIGERLLNG